jgi:hypothetical protein
MRHLRKAVFSPQPSPAWLHLSPSFRRATHHSVARPRATEPVAWDCESGAQRQPVAPHRLPAACSYLDHIRPKVKVS